MISFDSDEDLIKAFGPGVADKAIRNGIQMCWMSLPKERRNIPELKKAVERIVERVFRDLNEDHELFNQT